MNDNKRKRIAIIEDIDELREQYIMTLELEGYAVDSAANLQEALDLLEAKTFHLALVDLTLSDSTDSYEGIEVLKKLQERSEGTKSIVISAQDSPGMSADTISEYGAVKYIQKSRIRAEGTDYLMKEVSQLVQGVTFKKFTELNSLLAILAGPDRHTTIWSDPFIRILKPKGAARGFNEFLQKFCEPLVPLMPQPAVSPPLALNIEYQFASGKFWSKGLGFPIELVICRAYQVPETEIIKQGGKPTISSEVYSAIRRRLLAENLNQTGNPIWQNSPEVEYESYGLLGYAFRLPESVKRSEFVAMVSIQAGKG